MLDKVPTAMMVSLILYLVNASGIQPFAKFSIKPRKIPVAVTSGWRYAWMLSVIVFVLEFSVNNSWPYWSHTISC